MANQLLASPGVNLTSLEIWQAVFAAAALFRVKFHRANLSPFFTFVPPPFADPHFKY